jgi:microcystin-dependent protein
MSEPFLGEIRVFSFPFAPRGWAFCDGAIMPIATNQALFSLLGTYYGGNGTTTFALPDLRGRVPVHTGNGVTIGQSAGEEAHTLTQAEMPAHSHIAYASNLSGSTKSAQGSVWAQTDYEKYSTTGDQWMNNQALASVGGNLAHTNMQPYIGLNFCIALTGIYPTRN